MMRAPAARRLTALFNICLALVILTACGPSQRQRTLNLSFTAANAAKAGFEAWDAEHQTTLVTSATSLADGQAKLAHYRQARAVVVEAFALTYAALAAGAIDSKTPTLRVLGALQQLVDAIATLQGRPGTSAPAPATSTAVPAPAATP